MRHSIFSRIVPVVVALFATTSAFCDDLAPEIPSGSLFSRPLRSFDSLQGKRFNWVKENSLIRLVDADFTIGEVKLGEVLVTLDNGVIKGLKCSVYNRGDDSPITDAEFTGKLGATYKELTRVFGVAPRPANRKSDPTRSTFDIGGYAWSMSGANALLEYSVKNVGVKTVPAAEYIRLTILPAGSGAAMAQPKVSSARGKKKLTDCVKRTSPAAAEIVGVPMVDQGSKGYCAAATVARVMGYYGYEELDQHQIAQWAQSDPKAGTDMYVMLDGIKRVLHDKYGLNINSYDMPDGKEFLATVKKYNEIAKKEKKPQIELSYSGRPINMGDVYASMDVNLLRKMKTSNAQRNQIWFKRVKDNVDKGIPIIWCVQLGIVTEPEIPQAGGGHMRLITGYEADGKNIRIVYTDSWGDRHSRKTMAIEDAIVISKGEVVISPRLN